MPHAMKRRSALTAAGSGLAAAIAASTPERGHAAMNGQTTDTRSLTTHKTARRAELLGLLGDLPDSSRPVTARTVSTEDAGPYLLEKLELDLNGIEPVPAFLVKPRNATGRIPAVLYNHAHFGDYPMGKNEFIRGRDEIQKPAWAEQLVRLGYAAMCIDAWGFGERSGRTESSIFKEMLWNGRVMWGMMVYDSMRALDYLVSRDDIDPGRIGTQGMSMGSTMAWWLAALDTRVTVCADICCLTDFDALIEDNGLDRHSIYYYVPGLLRHFTASEINGLISPRPHIGVAGKFDGLTPLDGLRRIDRELTETYRRDGAPPEAWKLSIYDVEHVETPGMRAEIIDFYRRWL